MSKSVKNHISNGLLVGKDESGKYNSDHGWSASHDDDGSSEVAPLWLNGEVVALVVMQHKSLRANLSTKLNANARRLVACWNFCDGISTASLELNKVQALIDGAIKAGEDEVLRGLTNEKTTDSVAISNRLVWNKVPGSIPPESGNGVSSPRIWLALHDGRVISGYCLHRPPNAMYEGEVHGWTGDGEALDGDEVIGWMPFAVPDHPGTLRAIETTTQHKPTINNAPGAA